MKKTFQVLLILILIISCSQKSQPEISKNDSVKIEKDSATTKTPENKCLAEFKNLRDCIYQGKREEMKKYFDFPLKGNDFWYLVWVAYGAENDSLEDKQELPFTEKDFDKYYNKIFPVDFVKCLLKVKSEELFEKGKYETEPLIDYDGDYVVKYWIEAIYDKKTGVLELKEYFVEYQGNKIDENNRLSDSTMEFDFKFDKNCNLKYDKFFAAD